MRLLELGSSRHRKRTRRFDVSRIDAVRNSSRLSMSKCEGSDLERDATLRLRLAGALAGASVLRAAHGADLATGVVVAGARGTGAVLVSL
jgi:hypothetical protein